MTKDQITALYEARQARLSHPAGNFDRGGRWYPGEGERRPCCDEVRSPSRHWPYSLLAHCRSKKHIGSL